MSNIPVTPKLRLNDATVNSANSPTPMAINGASFSDSLAMLQQKLAPATSRSSPVAPESPPANTGFGPQPALAKTTTLAVNSDQPGLLAEEENVVHERTLALRAYRQQLLASNIANADTPGYQAVDIDIQEALRTGKTVEAVRTKFVIPGQGSVDGNTVELDTERVKFTENALMYEYEVDRVKSYYKDMEDLLKNTPY